MTKGPTVEAKKSTLDSVVTTIKENIVDQIIDLSKIDLDSLPLEELSDLLQRVQSAVHKKEQARIKELRDQARSLAKSQGVSVEALLGIEKPGTVSKPASKRTPTKGKTKRKGKGSRGPVAPKYRNPDASGETWTGRGQMPRWMRAKIEAGAKKDDFLIK